MLGSLRTSATAEIVDSTGRGGRTVALTFDDGPDPRHTPRLLALLRARHVTAVFCLSGAPARRHPDLVRRIVADGHLLGNHSINHDDLGTWTPERIRADLLDTNAAIRAAVPGARIPYFRAPFGSWGRSPAVAAGLGMQPLGWRLAVGDWETPGADELARRLIEGLTPGAVVLLHDGDGGSNGGGDRGQTIEAVARVVPELRAGGWRFTRPARRA